MARPNVLHFFLDARPSAPRWPYAFPALASLLFVGHAFEDGGWQSGALYLAIVALSMVGAWKRSVLVWAALVLPFLAYTVAVALSPENGPVDEWFLFMLLGFGPVVALWVGRPWAASVRSGLPADRP